MINRFSTALVFGLLILISSGDVALGDSTTCPPIKADSKCYAYENQLVVQTIIAGEFRGQEKSVKLRHLFRATCDLGTNQCRGMEFRLSNLECGNPISFPLDITLPSNLTIVSKIQNVFVLQFGPYKTYTVDLISHKVTRRESADNSESFGEGICESEL